MVTPRRQWVAASFFLILSAGTRAWAAEPTPDDVLKERGLSKSGVIYVLAEPESEFLEQLKAVEPYFARLQEGRQAILAMAENDAFIQAAGNRLSEVNSSVELLDHTIGRFGRKNTIQKQELIAQRAMLVQERASLRPQLDAARSAGVPPAQRRPVFEQFEKMRTEFLEKARHVTPAAERVQAQYRTLAKDAAVAGALKALRQAAKARIEIGPSHKFKAAYRDLQAAVNGAKTPEELMQEYASRQLSREPGKGKTTRVKKR